MRLPGGSKPLSVEGRTVDDAQQNITLLTVPPNSAGVVEGWIGVVSNQFTQVAWFNFRSIVRRDGSGDGSQYQYALLASDTQFGPGPSISIGNTLTNGDLVITVNGKFGHTLNWKVFAVSALATRT
jgi:hypothetical protein